MSERAELPIRTGPATIHIALFDGGGGDERPIRIRVEYPASGPRRSDGEDWIGPDVAREARALLRQWRTAANGPETLARILAARLRDHFGRKMSVTVSEIIPPAISEPDEMGVTVASIE